MNVMKIIDLHGIRHKDASLILEQNLLGYDKPYLDTQIIHGNSPEMRRIVHEFLDLHDFRYHIESWNQGKTIIVG